MSSVVNHDSWDVNSRGTDVWFGLFSCSRMRLKMVLIDSIFLSLDLGQRFLGFRFCVDRFVR